MTQNNTTTTDKPIAYHKPQQEISPFWCPDCEPSRDDGLFGGVDTESLTADDLDNFEDVSCVSCGIPLLSDGEPTGEEPGVHSVESYEESEDYCPNSDTDGRSHCPYCGAKL